MVHTSVIERRRLAQLEKAKATSEAMDTRGHQEPTSGETMTRVYKKKSAKSKPTIMKVPTQSTIPEPEINHEETPISKKSARAESIPELKKVARGRPQKKQEEEEGEEICFYNGENSLKIKYFRKDNRMYCVKVLLNDECEIRPVNYPGSSAGNAYWKLLKSSMKK